MSLKKGGAADEVPKALRYLLADSQELKEVEEQSQTTGQWLADILEYRRLPTPMTLFDYITLSDSTEMKVQEASLQTARPCLAIRSCCKSWTCGRAWLCLYCITLATCRDLGDMQRPWQHADTHSQLVSCFALQVLCSHLHVHFRE